MARRVNIILAVLGAVVGMLMLVYRVQEYGHIKTSWRDHESWEENYGYVIALDIGDEYSRVGIQRNGTFEIIPDEQGYVETPSWVAFNGDEVLVGYEAKQFAVCQPKNTITQIRTLLGRKFPDNSLQNHIKRLPYTVIEKRHKPYIEVRINNSHRICSPEEVLSHLIIKLKSDAEKYIHAKVTHTIITVPTWFADAQLFAMKEAAWLAGLKVIRMTREPSAASIAYHLELRDGGEEFLVLVYDVQEKGIDVTVSSIDDGVYEVLSTTRITEFGGDDLNDLLFNHVADTYNKANNIEIRKDSGAMGRLRHEVKTAEQLLLSNHSANITIQPRKNTSNFSFPITPSEYQTLSTDFLTKSLPRLQTVLKAANATYKSPPTPPPFKHIIPMGTPTQISNLIPFFQTHFPNTTVHHNLPAHELYVRGGASVGEHEATFTYEISYIEVTPLSLGVQTSSGVITKLIPRNTVIPTRKCRFFSTVSDFQTRVRFNIFEGERSFPEYSTLLGTVEVDGIQSEKAGRAKIDVCFEVDPDMGLSVNVSEVGGNYANGKWEAGEKLRWDEERVEGAVMEAEMFMAKDFTRRVLEMGREGREKVIKDEFGVVLWEDMGSF